MQAERYERLTASTQIENCFFKLCDLCVLCGKGFVLACGGVCAFLRQVPVKIERNTRQHDSYSKECFPGLLTDGVHGPRSAEQQIKRRQPRISGTAIGPGCIWHFYAQNKDRAHRRYVAEDHHKHYVGIQLVIATTKYKCNRPHSLHNQARDRRMKTWAHLG